MNLRFHPKNPHPLPAALGVEPIRPFLFGFSLLMGLLFPYIDPATLPPSGLDFGASILRAALSGLADSGGGL